eukprot:Phypoly_transcript_20752.p1 GENE.Phypoly_transcript_20752~~Phypoly_transcript_20752.p1  ORF type:complete len:189 (+),score=19.96 Phypoly_transcript_20752:64-630(+)
MTFPGLALLAKAPSKKFVDEVFVSVFNKKEDLQTLLESSLQIDVHEAQLVISSVRGLIQKCLYEYVPGTNTLKLAALLPSDFQANLRDLFEKIILHHIGEWRDATIASQPSLPKMISMDYRIDIKSGSEAISRMSVPTVLVDLKVSKPPTNISDQPLQQNVIFELNKETINTIMDSLKFVQGQLNSIK